MTTETWATIVTTIVVPIVLRILVHYFPWLADAVTPSAPVGTPPAGTPQAAPPVPETPSDPQESAGGA